MAKPNIVIILNDDMGYSDLGCYGGEIQTPNLDRLAAKGVRFTQFYNTARCSPSRASLLTGLHPHQTGVGILTFDDGPEGYSGNLSQESVTIPEVLRGSGYRTYMSGKWHVCSNLTEPTDAWPLQRGFDKFFGTIIGAGSFYHPNTLTRGNESADHEAKDNPEFFYTDAISSEAVSYVYDHAQGEHANDPFFMYVAYTAPHWPLHAHPEDIAKYKGRFDAGWDVLREQRLERLIKSGILDEKWKLTDRDPTQPPFEQARDREWLVRCMEVYAAQIDRMDQGIGRILKSLEDTGKLDNTVVIFLADNGGCAEDIPQNVDPKTLVEELMIAQYQTRDGREVRIGNYTDLMPGAEDTYQSYGPAWANLSNAPFRLYKHFTHEGGISTPLIVHWPAGNIDPGSISHEPGQLTDLMATVLDVTGATYPQVRDGHTIPPCEGTSLRPGFNGGSITRTPLFWEHEGNAAVRDGKWKLVRRYPDDWELYDMDADRTELHDLAAAHPDRVRDMAAQFDAWAARCGVIPRETVLRIYAEQGAQPFWEEEPPATA
jgi:arylsulfatase